MTTASTTAGTTARTAAAACGVGAVLLIGTAAAFRWSGQPIVVGLVLGLALLVVAMLWRTKDGVPRLLPTATMLIGMALVVAPPVLDYDDGTGNEYVAVAYVVHVVVGLAMAALGYWSGKRLGTPRVDKM